MEEAETAQGEPCSQMRRPALDPVAALWPVSSERWGGVQAPPLALCSRALRPGAGPACPHLMGPAFLPLQCDSVKRLRQPVFPSCQSVTALVVYFGQVASFHHQFMWLKETGAYYTAQPSEGAVTCPEKRSRRHLAPLEALQAVFWACPAWPAAVWLRAVVL